MSKRDFQPFYERLIRRFPGYIVGEVLVSSLLGIIFLAAHYGSIRSKVFKDFSWFLSVLISTAMLCLYYATYTLRRIFPEMNMHLLPDDDQVYMIPLKNILSDRNFVLAGIFFGLSNCVFGLSFGLPYQETGVIPNIQQPGVITILFGYLLAGFVCGMAVLGIYGVSMAIITFSSKAKGSFDFTSPDRCGGTQFLGEALVIFGSVTLIVGVMISIYILKTDWYRKNTWWVISLKGFWIIFPYIMSLIVLVVPAVATNKALREYKMNQEITIQKRLTKIRHRLENNQLDTTEKAELHEEYEFQKSLRKDLYCMRTWPYGLSANLKYLAVLIPNVYASVNTASVWIEKLLKPNNLS